MKVIIAKHLSKKNNGDYISSERFLNEMVDKEVIYPYSDEVDIDVSEYDIAIINSYQYLINKSAINDIVKYILDLFLVSSLIDLQRLIDDFERDIQQQLAIISVRQSFILERAEAVREALKQFSILNNEFTFDPFKTPGDQLIQLLIQLIERDFLRYYYSYLHDVPGQIERDELTALIKYCCQYRLLDYLTSRYNKADLDAASFIDELETNNRTNVKSSSDIKDQTTIINPNLNNMGNDAQDAGFVRLFKDPNDQSIKPIIDHYRNKHRGILAYLIRALLERDIIYDRPGKQELADVFTNTFNVKSEYQNIQYYFKNAVLDTEFKISTLDFKHQKGINEAIATIKMFV